MDCEILSLSNLILHNLSIHPHIQDHILDALCVRDSFSLAISPKVYHQAIMVSFIFSVRESCKFQHVSICKIHKINIILDFRMDILKSDLIRCPYKTASLLSHQYFNTLRNLLDKHARIKKKIYQDMLRLIS